MYMVIKTKNKIVTSWEMPLPLLTLCGALCFQKSRSVSSGIPFAYTHPEDALHVIYVSVPTECNQYRDTLMFCLLCLCGTYQCTTCNSGKMYCRLTLIQGVSYKTTEQFLSSKITHVVLLRISNTIKCGVVVITYCQEST